MKFGQHLFNKEEVVARTLSPTKVVHAETFTTAIHSVSERMRIMEEALLHISKTSDNYESKYAKEILKTLN